MTKENQKKLYNHFLETKQLARAEEIDKVYNFSGKNKPKTEENVLDKIKKKKQKK